MQLSPKALNALVDINRELLSRESVREDPPAPLAPPKQEKKQKFNGKHFARPANRFQRGCQRHEFWSPVF